jgi:hypothetical protein
MKQHTRGSNLFRANRPHARWMRSVVNCISIALLADAALAEVTPGGTPMGRIATYAAGRLELNTDLPPGDAKALLKRMESTLRKISEYWRRPLSRRIVCFVADDLSNWSDESLPHPQAKIVLQHVGGGTDLRTVEDPSSQDQSLVAHVYATSARGIAEHEVVHAYCMLTFGTCGPEWYKEGMAEMAFYYSTDSTAVRCPAEVAQLLRGQRAKSVGEIIGAGEFTQPIAARFHELNEAKEGHSVARSEWQARDSDTVSIARESYHRSWALCYFLSNNTNYHDRFRQLGICYLTGMEADFDKVFGPDAEKLAFEFELFLRDIEDGYRVDLCRWNWKKEFATIGDGETIDIRVLAARGYQPTGLIVAAGEDYDYASEGRWSACDRREPLTADGDYFGQGCLEAVIVTGYKLGEPFPLGTSGSFAAPRTGKLYLRCRDDWHALADNEGQVDVRLERGRRGSIRSVPK